MRSTKHQKKKQKHSTKNNLNLIHYQHASMPAAKILKLVNSRCPGNTFLAPSRSMRVTFYYSSCLLTCLFIICVLSLFSFFFSDSDHSVQLLWKQTVHRDTSNPHLHSPKRNHESSRLPKRVPLHGKRMGRWCNISPCLN